MAVEAGVKCTEHGLFVRDETVEFLVERGVYLAPLARVSLTHPDQAGLPTGVVADRLRQVNGGAVQDDQRLLDRSE